MTETAELTATEMALARVPEIRKIEVALDLPPDTFDYNGLGLDGLNLDYDSWEQIGHYLGTVNRWSKFALGDWLNWGIEAFAEGDIWAQATEGTPHERYDVAHRVTGLSADTLRNYASVCGRVARSIRRSELAFSTHEAVAALDPAEQIEWLERAVQEGWSRDDLRAEIKAALNPAQGEGDVTVLPAAVSTGERAFEVLQLVAAQGQPTSDGGALIPPEVWAQVQAAVGEE